MAGLHVWVVHTPVEIANAVEKTGAVAIGWVVMGNLSLLKTREEIKEKYREVHPEDSEAKVGIGAGTLHRFANEMKEGDFVLTPLKVSREVLIGKVSSDYIYDPQAISIDYPNIRRVKWLKKVSRDQLSAPLRNSIGGIMAVFSVDSHIREVEALLVKKKLPDAEVVQEPPFHEQVQAQADEMISDLLSQIDFYDFQYLVAGLLKAMGFKVRVSSPGPDKGVDILASPDAFGFQTPRIRVQVKHRRGQAGAPEVQQLAGAAGQNEALFVSTGGFTPQAIKEAEKHPKLALIDRDRFVTLLLEHYEKLDPEHQALIPLKKIYIPVP